MPSAISPTESMSPTKAPFVFPAEQPELIVSPSDTLSPQLPSLGDFMGSSSSSFMDEKADSDLMRVPSNGSSVYSNLNDYRKSRIVTVGANESALDDIVKFTNVQAERMLSPQGSIQDFQAQRPGSSPSLNRPEPTQRTSGNSDKSIYSAYSPGGTNIAQRTSPSQPPQSPLPALPLGKKRSSQFTTAQSESFTEPSASYTSPLASPHPYNQQPQTQRKVSPPINFSSNNPFGASGGFSPVDSSQYSLGSQTQPQPQSYQQNGDFGQQERNSSFPPQSTNNELPSSLRPFSPPIDHTMGTNGSTMRAAPSKPTKEPQSLQHAEVIEQTAPPSAPMEPKKGERKVSPTAALGNFANLRNKLTARPSEDVQAQKAEGKEKGSRFGKLKSKMRSGNEDENSSTTSVPKISAAKEEGSGWSRLKSKVKRNGDEGVEKDKDGRPMLAPISTTNPTDTTNAPKLGSPFSPSVSTGFEAPTAPQYQAYSPASAGPDAQQQRPRGDTSASTIRPYTPAEGAGSTLTKTDSELALTPTALELSQVHPIYRSEILAGSTETLTKLDSLRAPAPQFHPDAALRQRAGSAPTRGGPGGLACGPNSGPNSGTNSPMISRNNSAYNSGANSPSTQSSGYPFPALPPGQERRPQTGVVKGPKNDYPMLMPKELSSEMSAILKKSPFLNTPANKRRVLPSSSSDKEKSATDGAGSAFGGSSGSNTLVAEDDTVYPAPPISLIQLECFQAHRQMRTSRNDIYAIACAICNAEDRGKRWCCAWCSLRCCQDCIRKLRSPNGGLVGVLNGLGKSDVVENLYAEKIEKAKEAEKLMGNLSELPTFSFDMEKEIAGTPQLDDVPGAFPITPQLV